METIFDDEVLEKYEVFLKDIEENYGIKDDAKISYILQNIPPALILWLKSI